MEGREHHSQASGALGDGGLIFSPSPWQEERAGAQGPAPIQLAARLRFGLCSGFWPHALVVAVKPARRAQPMVSYLGPLGKKMAILSAGSSAREWSWLTPLRRWGRRPGASFCSGGSQEEGGSQRRVRIWAGPAHVRSCSSLRNRRERLCVTPSPG